MEATSRTSSGEATLTPLVVINVRVPETVRQGLKVIAALEGRTMQEVAEEILRKEVEARRNSGVG